MIRPIEIHGSIAHVLLPCGIFAIIDASDVPLVSCFTWHRSGNGYVSAYATQSGKRKTVLMHRLIAGTPVGLETDHISGNTLDNRKANLRIVTHAQNLRNTKLSAANKSGFKGVYWERHANKWRAIIKLDGKKYHLGYYDDAEAAHAAYCVAAKKLHGEFARTE